MSTSNASSDRAFPKKWILLRGLIRSQFHWQDFDEKLKASLPIEAVLKPELAGNGFRATEASPDLPAEAVQDIREQVQSSLGQEKVGVIAISLGGMLGLEWVKNYPQDISHLVLINSSLRHLSPSFKRMRLSNWPALLRLMLTKNPVRVENFILQNTINSEEARIKLKDAYLEFQKQHPVKVENFFRQLFLATQSSITRADLNQVGVHVGTSLDQLRLLVLNAAEDRLVHPNCSEKIATEFKADLKTHPWAGHDLPADDPQWIIDQIRQQWLS